MKISLESKAFGWLWVGMLLVLGWGTPALAIYSPTLNDDVVEIRQHIVAARTQNGAGTWMNAMSKLNQANAVAKAQGKATGIPGGFFLYDDALKEIIVQSSTESFLDGISLLFGSASETKSAITTCLRDDIWQLQALQEEVLNELFKSALLNDDINSRLLWKDYIQLKTRIDGDEVQKVLGLKEDYKNTEKWFPDGDTNYYVDCPSGEFTTAIQELVRTVEALGEKTEVSFGSFTDIPAIAESRAAIKAAEYIAKNQIKISLGGERGANPAGLISGNGAAGIGAVIGTEYKIMKQVLDMLCASGNVTVAMLKSEGLAISPEELAKLMGGSKCLEQIDITKVGTDINQISQAAQANLKNEIADKTRLKNALRFNVQLNNVSEQGLIEIERKLVEINNTIKEAPKPNAIPGVCEQVKSIMSRQCKNKTPANIPDCK